MILFQKISILKKRLLWSAVVYLRFRGFIPMFITSWDKYCKVRLSVLYYVLSYAIKLLKFKDILRFIDEWKLM